MHDEELDISVDNHTWIFESPDQGKTVHKRLIGSLDKFPYKDAIEDDLQDKLGIDIIEKVTKAVGE